MNDRIPNYAWGLILILALCWGGSFPASKIALQELDPFTVVMYRLIGAAALLWIFALMRKWTLPSWKMAPQYLALGFFSVVLPFTLIAWGQTHIESGLAAILNATTAIFGALFSAIFFADERLTPNKISGMIIAFFGVIITIGWQSLSNFSLREWGQLAVLCASISYGIGSVYTKARFSNFPARTNSLAMLSASAMLIVVFNLAFLRPAKLMPSGETWIALSWIAFVATALAYLLFYHTIKIVGAGNITIVTLLIAPIAIIVSAILLDEQLSLNAFFGFAMLALGLLVLDGRIRFFKKRS